MVKSKIDAHRGCYFKENINFKIYIRWLIFYYILSYTQYLVYDMFVSYLSVNIMSKRNYYTVCIKRTLFPVDPSPVEHISKCCFTSSLVFGSKKV